MQPNKYFYHWYYYTRSQKRGFIFFLLLVLFIQLLLCWIVNCQSKIQTPYPSLTKEHIDLQKQIDSLRIVALEKRDTIYPFNPNYINDYKGYILGLTTEEIDRLLLFRANHQYVNSKQEFQKVTNVSEEWMEKYSPYFVFSTRPSTGAFKSKNTENESRNAQVAKQSMIVQNINQATEESLQQVRGIGPVLAKRIIADREKWGGYVHLDQLKFVYGLSEQAIEALFQQYAVLSQPKIELLDLNEAGVNELKNIPYLNYYLAREIVKYRSLHGDFVNKEQLREIEKIPLDKIHIISLYLKIRN